MVSTTAGQPGAAPPIPEDVPGIDPYLATMDSVGGCLFVAGFVALLLGVPILGLGFWLGGVWLDWRVLTYLRSVVSDAAQRRRYVHFKVTMMALGQGLAVVLGLFVATRGHLLVAVAIWGIAAGGVACTRALRAAQG